MHLTKRLERWQQAGLISAKQAAAIAEHEARHGGFSSGWGFGALGVFAIVVGVIALVAANWYDISDGVKLVADFGGLFLLGWALWRTAADGSLPLRRDLLIMGYMGYVLASIGLIGQIFQLTGPAHHTALFWCALTLPVLLLGARLLPAAVWMGALIFSVGGFMGTAAWAEGQEIALHLAMAPALLLLAMVLRGAPAARQLGAAARLWGWVHFFWLWVAAGILGQLTSQLTNWADRMVDGAMLVPFLILLGALAVAVQLERGRAGAEKSLLVLAMTLFGLMAVLAVVPVLPAGGALASHALGIGCVLLLAVYAAAAGRPRLFNALTLLAGLRLVWIYLDLIGGLALTGLGLISTGVMILLAVYLWNRNRETWLERIAAWHSR